MRRVSQEIEKVKKELIQMRNSMVPINSFLYTRNILLLKQLVFFRNRFPELDVDY